MLAAASIRGRSDRIPRYDKVEVHCAAVIASVPPNPTFLAETLRGRRWK